jgi:hypothetical protein
MDCGAAAESEMRPHASWVSCHGSGIAASALSASALLSRPQQVPVRARVRRAAAAVVNCVYARFEVRVLFRT